MPSIKRVKAPATAASTKLFSLVPAEAQRQMYTTLTALKPAKPETASGAEVAEVALCLAIGENDPVILACPAPGARSVRGIGKLIRSKNPGANGSRLAEATLSAVARLLCDATATALICAGKVDPKEDYRSALSFAARHKLSILFLVANTLTPGRRQKLDLRALEADLGIPVFSVDANDPIAAYRVATEALHNARHLRGPCVIEALTVNGKGNSAVSALDLLRSYMERHGNWPL
jgi:hypothetical protein